MRISEVWPVKAQHKYFIERREGFVSHVGVIFEALPIDEAPTFFKASGSIAESRISIKGNRIQEAVQGVRAWQSLLATYVIVDVDFDDISQEFKPEGDAERERVHILSFNSNRNEPNSKIMHDFSIFGRAFLAVDRGVDLIEPMAFFIEGRKALAADRLIDAYNYCFLFLESRFKLKHQNRLAAAQLVEKREFCGALESILEDPMLRDVARGAKLALDKWPDDKEAIALEIVELRGRLRHHSIGNPNRWNPTEQQKYRAEAVFLAAICREIAKPSFDITWEDTYVQEFVEQAKAMGMQLDVSVVLTIDDGTLPREIGMNFKIPQFEPSAMLAKTVLENALTEFDKHMPGAQLLGIRARVRPNGPELFRYDLGPGIRR
ncbi:hypothetical protein [Bradyrhizobium murdochi]|uniref:hypothetical protein n=1 Tax=Bradyrhizobium murdochi TaxID=1038859 RepID=UPI0012EBF0B1|nr:hypothetical protein [Bradyrhizobium murdochi]